MHPPSKIENILAWNEQDFLDFVAQTNGGEHELLLPIAQSLLNKAIGRFSVPYNAIDICGTGGDGLKTTNISTISSFVLACMGIPVAKHGGRSVSSSSGSIDFLEALHIPELPPLESLQQYTVCFLKAQNHHPAMKHIAPFRKNYGKKTIFNMLGPLLNPASISHQMVGNSFPELALYNATLNGLGRKQFAVLRSQSGADELLPFEDNHAIIGNKTIITNITIKPQSYGLKGKRDASITGLTPQENAENTLRFFEKPLENCLLETIALNCGFASYVFEKHTIKDGVEIAIDTILSRKPMELITAMQQCRSL